MEELYVDRYLCPDNQIQNLDTFSFLMGEMSYISPEVVYTMDVYNQFQDIRNNPYNFIIGNGGLGKSTYLKQIKTTLEKENIPLPANIPAVARINSLGIIIITASNTIPRNIPKYPKLVIKEVI